MSLLFSFQLNITSFDKNMRHNFFKPSHGVIVTEKGEKGKKWEKEERKENLGGRQPTRLR